MIPRPKTRQEVREDIAALVKRWDLASEQGTLEEREAAYEKYRKARALQEKFYDARLADFKMPPPSPPRGESLFFVCGLAWIIDASSLS